MAIIRSNFGFTPLAKVTGGYLTRGGVAGTLVLVNGQLTLTPYWLPSDIDQIAINVTSAATAASGATIRFVVYSDSGNYAPTTTVAPLIDVVAAQNTESTGDKTASVTLTGRRWVWAGCVGQGAPATQATVRAVTAVSEHIIIGAVPAGNTGPTHRYAGITGAVPTPIGAAATAESSSIPRIAFRMS